ncbi:uncharacterized protein LOC111884638 [Lactuca sativa]|uniref:uncharacterized protein LOC111884638 n=1 Tax=Lactuca sativa TaxID=4236 RepID=UPI000CD854E3|nr:uncharacterized protein LOC111884638 [Lactuca sativa]
MFLAKHNLAFHRSNEKLYKKGNGNILGVIELLEEFDPVIKEHVRRITNDGLHVHYLGNLIQNELIYLLAQEIKKEHIKKIKEVKYYSIILDCTPDSSHQEQMTIIVSWESRVESVQGIKLQLVDVREALLQVEENANNFVIASEATSLAEKELGDFKFLVSTVIWYEVLNHVSTVSKKLQSKDMRLDNAISEINKLIGYFKDYRETGFSKAIVEAKETAIEMGIDPVFPQKRVIERKKRFEQFKEYEKVFGFLFPHNLRGIKDKDLKSYCHHLEKALKFEERSDIDAEELYTELKLLGTLEIDEFSNLIDVLKFLKELDYFPNASTAYRILLTIPVTVASAERSF